MRKLKRISGLFMIAIMLISTTVITNVKPIEVLADVLPYQDVNLSFEERAVDLVSRMTLAEKQSQMGNSASAIPRLGVPRYDYWSEGLHGVARSGRATSFPSSLSMSLTWDRDLIFDAANVTSDEARAYNTTNGKGLSYWSPTINLQRDPRWGRNEEAYGEDPYLTGQLGIEFVKGFQGDDPRYLKTIATTKHYAANNSENNRHNGSSDMDDRTLREYYTATFRDIAINAHNVSVMSAYNSINGVPSPANTYILDTLLRKTWGFNGYVTSDCGAINDIYGGHAYRPTGYSSNLNSYQATAFAIKAGTDIDCGSVYQGQTVNAVNGNVMTDTGLFTEDDVDRALVRMFTARMSTGEFDPPEMVPYRNYTIPNTLEIQPNLDVSLKASRETPVLLQNTDNLLPIDISKYQTIAVVGPMNNVVELGDYSGSPTTTYSFQKGLNEALAAKGFNTNNVNYYTMTGGSGGSYSGYVCNIRSFTLNSTKTIASTANSFGDCQVEGTVGAADSNIGYIHQNSYAVYNNVNLSDITSFKVETSTDGSLPDYVVDLHVGDRNGPIIASSRGYNTSGWTNYVEQPTGTVYADIAAQYTGNQQVTLVFHIYEAPITGWEETLNAVKDADLAIVYAGTMATNSLGLEVCFEERDRTNMDLPADQANIIKQVGQANPNTIAVMQAVGMVNVDVFKDYVKSMLWTSYNGQYQGLAMANLLLGDANPSGRLSFTWYGDESQLADHYDYNIRPATTSPFGRTYQYFKGTVLYPFGYGLSYSSFSYSNPTISAATVAPDGKFDVTVDVTNTSARAGADVVQVYVSAPNAGNDVMPYKQLKGFERVELNAGQTKSVTVHMNADDFWFIDAQGKRVVSPGAYKVAVGRSSQDIKHTFDLTIAGSVTLKPTVVTLRSDKIKLSDTSPVINTDLTISLSDETFLNPSLATIAYSSSNENVAVVDVNGKITAVGMPGTAVITAKVTYNGVTASGSVAVASAGEAVWVDDITADGITIPGFAADKYYYEIAIPYDVNTIPTIAAATTCVGADISYTTAAGIPGSAIVTVSKGGASAEYEVFFGRPPRYDKFVSGQLASHWSLIRPNSENINRSGAVDGRYTINTEKGDLYTNYNDVRNLVIQPATGDWSVQTLIEFNPVPSLNYQQGGIVVYQDDDNYFKLDVEAAQLKVQLAQESAGSFNALASTNISLPSGQMTFRVDRTGDIYTFYYSINGTTFTRIGNPVTMQLRQPKIALTASNGYQNSGDVASVAVSFIDFRVLSNEATLANVYVDGEALPYFNSATTIYDVAVPRGSTRVPKVTGVASLPTANVVITPAASIPGMTLVKLVGDGYSKDYSIYFGYPPEPDNFADLRAPWDVIGGNANASVSDGRFNVTTEYGDIFELNYTNPHNMLVQSASGDWSATVTVDFDTLPYQAYHQGSLIVYQDMDNYLKISTEYNNGINLQVGKEVSGSFSSPREYQSAITLPDGKITYKVDRKGDQYTFFYSMNEGVSYTQLTTIQIALAEPKLALFATNSTSSTASPINISFRDFNLVRGAALGEVWFTDANDNRIWDLTSSTMKVTLPYINESDAEKTLNMILGVYDDKGRLLHIAVSTDKAATIDRWSYYTVNVDMPANVSGLYAHSGYRASAYLWVKDTYVPVMDKKIFPK